MDYRELCSSFDYELKGMSVSWHPNLDSEVWEDKVNITTVDDLVFKRSIAGKKTLIVDDHCYIFNISNRNLYHGLIDVLGQYLTLREIFPDIVPIAIRSHSDYEEGHLLEKMFNWLAPAAPVYNLSEYSKIQISKTSFLGISENYLPRYALEELQIHEDINHKYPYRQRNIENVKKFIKRHAALPNYNSGRKIFLISNDKKLWDEHHLYARLLGLKSIINKRGGWNQKAIASNAESVIHNLEFVERYYPEEHFHQLKDYFGQKGYEIINPMDYSTEEQIDIVNSASHIVTTPGSNHVHALFANSECIFTTIYLNPRYNFPYHHFLEEVLGDRVNIIFDKRKPGTQQKTYFAEEAIQLLEKEYKDRI